VHGVNSSMIKPLICAALAFLCFAGANTARAQQNETDNIIKFFQWKVSQDPDDFFNYDKLGTAYIQKSRETGDITYFDLAQKALEKSLELESTDAKAAPATKHLATVYFSEHRFADALALAQKALALNPDDLTPWALIGDAQCEMGEYAKAWESYAKLRDPKASPSDAPGLEYLRVNRESSRAFLSGETKAAIAKMEDAVKTSIAAGMAKENIAWSQFTLGEDYFLAGDLAHAKSAYESSLKTYPIYHRGLSGIAKVAAAEGRLSEAIDDYKRAIVVIPFPAYVAALGDVYAKSGNAEEAKKQYALVEYIGRLNAFNQTVYNRELAVFYADHDIHLPESLALARKEFEIRHDIYTWDALAWALYKNGQLQEASTAMKEALKLGTNDALLYFHAGMIDEKLDMHEAARDYLHRAMNLNPQFNILHADAAQAALQKLSKDSVAAKDRGTSDARP
jgi:tetratricopeptide (TPR) repeat protein